MAKKRTNRFSGRTSRSMERPANAYGYLNVPDNINVFKAEGGTQVVFDIMPYTVTDANHMDRKKYDEDANVGELWWKRPLKVHRDVGPDKISAICPTTFGKKCPICEHGSRRRKDGAEWEGELEFIFPKNRTLFYIVPVDSSECEIDYVEGDVHIFDMSDHNFLKILDEDVKRDVDYEGFPDHEDGMSLKAFFRQKKLGKNKYAEASKIDFIQRDEQYDDEFIEGLPSLDDILKVLSYKELDALYFGMEDLDDEDTDTEVLEEEEEASPRRKKRTAPARRQREPEPESKPEVEEATTVIVAPSPRKLAGMSRRALNKLAKEIDIDPTDFAAEEIEELRREIAIEMEIDLPEVEVEAEPEPEPERKAVSRRVKKDKCPHGLKFGVDTDSDDACDDCKLWDDCAEAKDNA